MPDTDPTIALQRGGNGYGREFRFFTDGSLSGASNNTIFRLQPSGSDVIDGALYNEQVQRQFDGITIVGTPGQWLTLQRKSK